MCGTGAVLAWPVSAETPTRTLARESVLFRRSWQESQLPIPTRRALYGVWARRLAACPLRPTYSSANGRVQPSLAVSSHGRFPFGRRSKMLQRFACVCSFNHAALAPCCKTHGYRGRAALAAAERCLGCRPRRELVTVAFSEAIPDGRPYTRPTQAIPASLIP